MSEVRIHENYKIHFLLGEETQGRADRLGKSSIAGMVNAMDVRKIGDDLIDFLPCSVRAPIVHAQDLPDEVLFS